MELLEAIQKHAADIEENIISIRRHLHQNPELSCHEEKTALFIADELRKLNIDIQTGIGGYGVVGIIHGSKQEPCIALRADMDALPIQEESGVPFSSCVPGVMHACGHDVHMAVLLGVANILSKISTHLNGSVKLIFQPSEETFPGGALAMINDGVLKNPDVQSIAALHVLPQLPAGVIGLKPGMYMASTDEVYLKIIGKGGHGATPELNIDPVVIAANILLALQQIPSRMANPAIPTVLSFGRFMADGRTNIIPDQVVLEGTLRTFNENWREKAHQLIHQIASGIAAASGAICEIDIRKGYPFLVNDDTMTMVAGNAAAAILGNENVIELPLRMTAEDFSYFSHIIPGIYYRLGVAGPNGDAPNLHTSRFSIDESAVKTGLISMSAVAVAMLDELNNR